MKRSTKIILWVVGASLVLPMVAVFGLVALS